MADRIAPIRKNPTEILGDLMDGHTLALVGGPERGKKYLLSFHERNNSIPNAVKFFLFDLLVEDAYTCNDLATCRSAMAGATEHLPAALAELPQRFRDYAASIHLFERGIALAVDEGDFDAALALCDKAIALDLGKVYTAKRLSIERMM